MAGFMSILSINVNSQNNNIQIMNEHWINEGYPHRIYIPFDYYSFFDDGTFVNNYGVYNSGTFCDITIRGQFYQTNNIIELKIIEKTEHGFLFLARDKPDSFIIEIIDINKSILKIKYFNSDEIIIMNRYDINEISDILTHRKAGF